jgi:hypothetical protein
VREAGIGSGSAASRVATLGFGAVGWPGAAPFADCAEPSAVEVFSAGLCVPGRRVWHRADEVLKTVKSTMPAIFRKKVGRRSIEPLRKSSMFYFEAPYPLTDADPGMNSCEFIDLPSIAIHRFESDLRDSLNAGLLCDGLSDTGQGNRLLY